MICSTQLISYGFADITEAPLLPEAVSGFFLDAGQSAAQYKLGVTFESPSRGLEEDTSVLHQDRCIEAVHAPQLVSVWVALCWQGYPGL